MYRHFNALVVEEDERRSLKTKSSSEVLSPVDINKAQAYSLVFICVQDICLLFITHTPSHSAHHRPAAHLNRGRDRISPNTISAS